MTALTGVRKSAEEFKKSLQDSAETCFYRLAMLAYPGGEFIIRKSGNPSSQEAIKTTEIESDDEKKAVNAIISARLDDHSVTLYAGSNHDRLYAIECGKNPITARNLKLLLERAITNTQPHRPDFIKNLGIITDAYKECVDKVPHYKDEDKSEIKNMINDKLAGHKKSQESKAASLKEELDQTEATATAFGEALSRIEKPGAGLNR